MYDYIHGKLIKKLPTEAVVDVGGLGFYLKISLSSSQRLPEEGEMVTLKTHLYVREDVLQLYGFANEEERTIFNGLIAISGIGPKLALTILSGMTPEKLISAVEQNDEQAFYTISGVGKKTAQRLIIELKDKLIRFKVLSSVPDVERQTFAGTLEEEVIMALISLGYSRQQAGRAVNKARQADPSLLTAEALIKKALQSV